MCCHLGNLRSACLSVISGEPRHLAFCTRIQVWPKTALYSSRRFLQTLPQIGPRAVREPEWEDNEEVIRIRSMIWEGMNMNKRKRNEEGQEAKRRKIDQGEETKLPIYATQFSAEEIAADERRPKKKVAVLMGYSGTGYHGMQLSDTEKTIEGELFPAFVAAGAISKANAADPKKSSLVRCARTDKGVHAAGNVVSLKLIVEDPDIVQKINDHLSPQIRIWGIQTTNKSFSCYQMCDSRIYEYLIPSHCFLPPHPSTYMGKKIVEIAERSGDAEGFRERQQEVATFWDEIDEKEIKPILEKQPEEIRRLVQKALYIDDDAANSSEKNGEGEQEAAESVSLKDEEGQKSSEKPDSEENPTIDESQRAAINEVIKSIKAAYLKVKRAYRIPETRLRRLQETLDKYLGTRNFYNYTIQKQYKDPSAKRLIKSFDVNPKPIIINGTEWLSMKVHGQSFMMHQIRKMVAMAAMVVRCGCDPNRIVDTYGPTKIAIPKAPGLGLLLERPIFDSYNKKIQELGKEKIDFGKYEKEIEEFKQREIYNRIFGEEEKTNSFGSFFNHIDHLPQEDFLYVTSGGIPAAKHLPQPSGAKTAGTESTTKEQDDAGGQSRKTQKDALAAVESDSDTDDRLPDGGEEGG